MSRSAFEVTRLAFADVVMFRRVIAELQQESLFRRMSYEPARRKIVNYHQSDSDQGVLERAISEFQALAAEAILPQSVTEPKNNSEVLETYLDAFAVPFRRFAGELPAEFSSYAIEIGGMRITGKPHIKVSNSRGVTKYLYLLTSKDWNAEQKSFFISILGEIVAANIPGATPRDVEGLDCRTGAKITRNGLGANFRSRIEYLAQDLGRMGLA